MGKPPAPAPDPPRLLRAPIPPPRPAFVLRPAAPAPPAPAAREDPLGQPAPAPPPRRVVHAIEAHHYEIQPQTVEAVLVIAADAISASRPGARGESLEHYIKRLESLEELAAAKPGVEKVYALQAGREIRVIVSPGDVSDEEAALLSHEIAREIEDQLEYPGQGKVTVIRESRAIDVAPNRRGVNGAVDEGSGLAQEAGQSGVA